MIDRGEGDGDRFAAFIGDHEGDDLGAGRAEFAPEGFVSDADHDLGSFGGEFHQRIPEGQDDVVTPIASGEIVARCRLHRRNVGCRHERVAETSVGNGDEVGADGDNRPGDAVACEGANGDRPPALGQIEENTAKGGLLGCGVLEPAASGAGPSRFVDLAIGDPPLQRRERVVGISVSPRRASATAMKSAPTAIIGPVMRWPTRVASSIAAFSSQRRRERA
jgi:hypothetical protein